MNLHHLYNLLELLHLTNRLLKDYLSSNLSQKRLRFHSLGILTTFPRHLLFSCRLLQNSQNVFLGNRENQGKCVQRYVSTAVQIFLWGVVSKAITTFFPVIEVNGKGSWWFLVSFLWDHFSQGICRSNSNPFNWSNICPQQKLYSVQRC